MTTDIRESTDRATDTSGRGSGTEKVAAFVRTDNMAERLSLLRRWAAEQNAGAEEAARCWALHIASAVVRGTVPPEEGLKCIVAVCGIDYDWRYQPFDLLDDDIDRLRQGETPLFNTGLTLSGWRQYVTEAFTLFLRMERNAIGREAETLSCCETCRKVSEAVHAQNGWRCPCCGSERLLHFTDLKGREMIYDHLVTHRNDSL